MAGIKRPLAGESIHHALERYKVQSDSDRMNGMCEEAEPAFQIGNRAFIADDMKLERSASIHYCGLNKVCHGWHGLDVNVGQERYLQQNCAFLGRGFRIHEKSKDHRFHWTLNVFGLHCQCTSGIFERG